MFSPSMLQSVMQTQPASSGGMFGLTDQNWAGINQGIGAIGQALGTWKAGQITKEIANWNSRQLAFEAQNVQAEAVERYARAQREKARLVGGIRAAQSTSGAEVGAGSSLEFQAEAAGMAELAALDNYRIGQIQQIKLKERADLKKSIGKYQSRTATIGAATQLIQGIGRAFSTYNG